MFARWWLLLRATEALILLGPPADHYDYYDSKHDPLFDFTATFLAAANGTAGGGLAVVDGRGASSLARRGAREAIRGVLDDIWRGAARMSISP